MAAGKLVFLQIEVAYWIDPRGRRNHTLYGLCENGRVYVLRAGKGWIDAEEEALQKTPGKYDSKYGKGRASEGDPDNDPF